MGKITRKLMSWLATLYLAGALNAQVPNYSPFSPIPHSEDIAPSKLEKVASHLASAYLEFRLPNKIEYYDEFSGFLLNRHFITTLHQDEITAKFILKKSVELNFSAQDIKILRPKKEGHVNLSGAKRVTFPEYDIAAYKLTENSRIENNRKMLFVSPKDVSKPEIGKSVFWFRYNQNGSKDFGSPKLIKGEIIRTNSLGRVYLDVDTYNKESGSFLFDESTKPIGIMRARVEREGETQKGPAVFTRLDEVVPLLKR